MVETPLTGDALLLEQRFRAIDANDRDLFRKLLDSDGLDVNFQCPGLREGSTLLHYVAYDSDIELSRLLLDRGADVNAFSFGSHRTALHYAARDGENGTILLLVKYGAVTGFTDVSGQTPAKLAVEHGHEKTAALIYACEEDRAQAEQDALVQDATVLRQDTMIRGPLRLKWPAARRSFTQYRASRRAMPVP